MTAGGCSRSWQAEAAHDGRLSEADVASFERHSATCAVCRGEVEALSTLRREVLRLPVSTSTALERRRLRNEVLRRANELTVGPTRRSRVPLAVALSLSMIVVATLLSWQRVFAPPPAPAAQSVADVPTFRITESPGARWHTVARGRTLRLGLEHGRFELSVDPLHAGQRFLLDLPDGEIEVKGTRFIVDVDGSRTLGVRVTEGRVALRLRAGEPRSLGAGDEFRPAIPPVSAPASSTVTAGAPTTFPSGTKWNAEPPASPSAPAPAPTSDFTVAMSAFSAGDYGRAERLFIDFERAHPGDARNEDALFLRAVARSRRGDADGARVAAREYVARYPNGFRRADAERLAR